MKKNIAWLALIVAGMLLSACSSTVITASWKNPDFSGKVKKVYVVGIAKQETVRRIFEDDFRRQLETLGASGISSYNDLPSNKEADKDAIAAKVSQHGADAVLLAHAVGKRTEQVVNPGYVSSTSSYGGGYRGGYYPSPYARNYGNYYARNVDVVYQPATVTDFEIVTIEANLYAAVSGELIWSAQLETVVDANLDKLVSDFVATAAKDLQEKGLL